MEVVYKNEWFVEFKLTDTAFLSIADETRATIEAAHGAGITLTWQVDDVQTWRTNLMRKGVDCTPIQTKWNASVTYFYDPEGQRIELWQPLQ